MKISIITACFNNETTIARTMQSVGMQGYYDIEHIVIDGASTDGSLQIVREHANNKTRIISEPDLGIYDALNKGIAAATGSVVGFLHADDFFASVTVLERIAEGFEAAETDAVYTDLVYIKQNGQPHRYWKSGRYKHGSFKTGWMPPHPTLYIKRSGYGKFGRFDLRFSSAADYELMLRFMHKHQIKVKYLPFVSVIMQVGGKSNQSLSNRYIANREDKRAWAANKIKMPIFTVLLKPLRKVVQFYIPERIKTLVSNATSKF